MISNREVRNKLYFENNRCYWCKKRTIMPEDCKSRHQKNMATLDHVISKNVLPNRRDSDTEVILSCFECNQHRANLEHKGKHSKIMIKYSEIKRLKLTNSRIKLKYKKA